MHPFKAIGCVFLLHLLISGNSGDCQRARGMDSLNDASIPKKPLFFGSEAGDTSVAVLLVSSHSGELYA